jgi:large conductance mechanosensitive channel
MWQEFKAFLIKQNALALAIAVVIGGALDRVVKSLVDGFVMPFVAVASPDPARYENMTLTLGSLVLRPGLIISAVINFLIVGFVAWRLAKLFIKEAPAAAAKAVKACPFCFMGDLDPKATRCPHCTSVLDEQASRTAGVVTAGVDRAGVVTA